jgi:hypothetical protein
MRLLRETGTDRTDPSEAVLELKKAFNGTWKSSQVAFATGKASSTKQLSPSVISVFAITGTQQPSDALIKLA